MTDQPAPGHPLQGLLVAGSRLGWAYHDPAASITAFGEQPPAPPAPSAPPRWPVRPLLLAAALGLILSTTVACCGVIARGPSGTTTTGTLLLGFSVMILAATGAALGLLVWRHLHHVSQASAPAHAYDAAVADWRRRHAEHARAEAARVADLPVWRPGGPRAGASRLDIVGGTPDGWRDLILVAGAGYLAAHGPSTILDLTGDQLAADLADLCDAARVSTDWQTPPADTDLLTGLDGAQLVDVLVESVNGEGDRTVRDSRATDTRVLTAVVEALGTALTPARLADALRVLLRIPGPTPTLTPAERRHLADELFPADYLSTSLPTLRRLEAHLHPLRTMTRRERPPAVLTIVAANTDGTSARAELLDDLLLAWITRRVAAEPHDCRTLFIVGADPLPARQVQRLADICHRHGCTLILLWRHLRDTAQAALGGGEVAFMRLRNGTEAARAADFIGRTHRFTLSGLSRTTGGSTSDSTSSGVTEAVSYGTTRARGGRLGALIRDAHAWAGGHGTPTGTSSTTSVQVTTGTGANWGDTTSTQRVYEYAVEPAVLQSLPEHALLLITHTDRGPLVEALDCNPAIVTLPAVAMTGVTPLDGLERPTDHLATGHSPTPHALPGQPAPVPARRTDERR